MWSICRARRSTSSSRCTLARPARGSFSHLVTMRSGTGCVNVRGPAMPDRASFALHIEQVGHGVLFSCSSQEGRTRHTTATQRQRARCLALKCLKYKALSLFLPNLLTLCHASQLL